MTSDAGLHDLLQTPADEQSQCYGKLRYASRAEAKRAMDYTRKRDKPRGKMTTYHCEFCSTWHNGSG